MCAVSWCSHHQRLLVNIRPETVGRPKLRHHRPFRILRWAASESRGISHVCPCCFKLDVILKLIIASAVVLTFAGDQLSPRWHIRSRECCRRLHDGAQGP